MNKIIRRYLLIYTLLFTANAMAGDGYQIEVRIAGATPNTGHIIVNLFDSKKNYLKKSVGQAVLAVDKNGQAIANLGTFAEGEYAVSVFYDENSNGKLDTGFMGIPKEKVGFSNNARRRYGPAKWAQTQFALTGEDVSLLISLKQAKDK